MVDGVAASHCNPHLFKNWLITQLANRILLLILLVLLLAAFAATRRPFGA
jgi:hypothetical protein